MYVAALAEDHFNDVISNSTAIATVLIAFHTVAWWVDPSGEEVVKRSLSHTHTRMMHDYISPTAYMHSPTDSTSLIHAMLALLLAGRSDLDFAGDHLSMDWHHFRTGYSAAVV